MKGMPKFNDVGNLITKNPKSDKIKELEKEFENVINGNKAFHCKYCDKGWDKKMSNIQHQRWCPKNPNPRTYRKGSVKKKKAKKTKTKPEGEKKPKDRPKKEVILQLGEFTVEDLRRIDKIFGLTDKEIIDYIRGKKS